ncbi:MAG: type II toxin-antitoxin system HicB family antitoxin [Chloroflexota bacterium]|nr:type II toxin-antitoxin system HicB family antitoxin [Chloroflexota bacterium]
MKFPVVVQPGEDGFYVAECPALPGCMSQGSTKKEALKNIKEAIELWLEVEADKKLGKLAHGAVLRTVAV